jgi:uncharacterized protein YggE
MRSAAIGPRQHFLVVLLYAGVISVPAWAAEAPVSSIRVTASANISAKPDRVQIDIGVSTRAPKSQDAASANARQVDAAATLKTVNYSLTPEYQYHPNGGEPTLTGYNASNIVQVTLDDLSRISAVLDAATAAGANQVQGIRFTLRDTDAVRDQALRTAALRARAEAEVLANALNLKIERVLQVEESSAHAGPVFQPMARAMSAGVNAAAPTPVEAGTLELSADVTLTVAVSAAAR